MNLNFMSPVNSLGYGIAGKHITYELAKLCNVTLFPVPDERNIKMNQDDKCASTIIEAYQKSQDPDLSAPCIRLWHQDNMSQFVGHGIRIGFPIFELDKFSEKEMRHLSPGNLDMMFVCSEWAKEVVIRNIARWNSDVLQLNRDDVKVIPLGVDREIFNENHTRSQDGITRFFNCGKTEIRKGHDVLHKVFNEAFKPEDNVELHIMWDNPFLSEQEQKEWHDLYLNTPMGRAGKIIFHDRVETSQEVAQVMSMCDCGVFLSRAEGWNLEALELLSLGKRIIITDYSAHTEFCHDGNSDLITIDDVEPAYDGKWFFNQGNWAKIGDAQITEATNYMRSFYNRHQHPMGGTVDYVNKPGIETAKQFTWKNTAETILEHLQ